MPLQSRVTRQSTPVDAPAPSADKPNLGVSPRRRSALSVEAAASDAAVAPRPDTLDEQEAQEGVTEGYVPDEVTEAHAAETTAAETETTRTPASTAGAGVAARLRKPRTTKPKPELPSDLSQLLNSEDPDELRAALKQVEVQVRAKRVEFDAEMKTYRTLYRDLAEKLAGTL